MSTKSRASEKGVVDEVLPNAMFSVRLDDGRKVRASIAATLRHGIVRIIGGARVEVELSHHDPSRGRIIKKL
jgi:translation initiation factor IF-1